MKNILRAVVAAACGALPLFGAVGPEGEGLDALSGTETWACRKSHPARVHSVMDAADDANRISLRGEWDFVMTTLFQGRRNSHDVPFFLTSEKWKSARKIVVPGCWEAQGVGEPGMGESWEFKYDHNPKPIRHKAMGEGWYRRTVRIPESWRGKRIWLKVGGVKSCGWFWVNGRQAAHVYNYCGSEKFDVTDLVKPGETAEIAAEVSNAVPSRKGLMSAMHRWGGLYRDVELEATPQVSIDDAWVRGNFDEKTAEVHVEVEGCKLKVEGCKLRAEIEGEVVEQAIEQSNNPNNQTILKVPLRDFRPWSPEHPNLYTAKVELVENGQVVQVRRERFGVRKLEVRGKAFYLNGRPFYVRGFGDDHVYPLTGITPADREIHLAHLRTARAAGFNFVRLHTHCEVPEYFEAADEAGILIEAELPYINGDIPVEHFAFDPVSDTKELWRNYRRHPSFAVYSGGNEGSFGPVLDRALYRMVKKMDPDRLKICQDSQMAFVNTPENSDFRGGPVDVWPRGSIDPDRPFLCHEYLNLCIKLDSRMEGDFTGAWLPPTTRAERTAWLGKFGLDHAWGDRLQDAQHRQQAYWQKHGVESARADPHCDGFCFWTIVDVVVKQFDAYTSQGFLDPFWRQKRGGWMPEEFAKFNSPTCVLADFRPDRRVFAEGERFRCDFLLSHYGERPLARATLRWKLSVGERVLSSGDVPAGDQPLGPTHKVGSAEIVAPAVEKPVRATFAVEIGDAANAWDVWLFPKRERRRVSGVVASKSLLPALGRLYDGIVAADKADGCRVAILAADDPLKSALLAKGAHVVSLGPVGRSRPRKVSAWTLGETIDQKAVDKFDCGNDDYSLGWWFMGRQVGVAMRESPLLGQLPHEGALSPLFFRIIGGGRPLPVPDVTKDDLVMVGEGGERCSTYVSSRSCGTGRLTEVNGLDLLSGYPEGTCILDGMIDATAADTLTVLTWNTEHYGWEHQSPEQAALRERVMFDVIRDSGADIVLIQETYGAFERFKKGLPGFHAALHNDCSSVYSRYPIVDTRILFTDRDFSLRYCDVGVSEVDCGGGRRVRVAPLAMNWQPYGTAMTVRIGDFKTAEQLLAWEREPPPNGGLPRSRAVVEMLAALKPARDEADRIPLVLGGDFNSQSHLDWTPATATMPEHGGLTVPWEVSTRMAEAGFTDTFRAINPDPVSNYGSTFPRTDKGPSGRDVRLRYDFIYSLGNGLKPIASECCTGRYLKPFRYRGKDYPMFPSDHGFVLTRFRWEPQGGFVRPQTTRRYLHGPLSERVAVFFREGKLTLGENIHRDDWGAMRYWKGTQPAHGVWLVHGADDAAFDFRKAVLNRDPDGVPVHSQTWRAGDLEVELAACMPVGLRTSIQARLTVTNRGTTPQAENVGFLLRAAPENKLVFGAPDIYKIYAPAVRDWRQLPSTFRSGAEATFADGDRFASFGGAPRWDAQAGAVRFAFELAPGASRTVDFAVGKGPVERPDFASAAAAVRAEWAKLLSRAKDRTPFVRGQIVQILQCFGQAKDEAFVLPRQGGLQRFVWPGETVHVVEALDRLGYGEYGAMAIDFLFRFARPDGQIGPFANDWASETAYVLETLARHCLVTDDRACWQRHRAAAWRGFEWIVAKRAETAAGGDGVVAGLFPPLKSTDSAKRFQHWGMTDLVNEHALKVFGEAAEHLGEPEAAKVIAEWRAYRAVIERVLDRWRQASSGRDTFFIPLAPDGANEAKFRAENFFYLHPGAFAEGGYLTKDEMLRLRTWLVREGIANEVGLYQHHPSADPTLGDPIWYTTWSEYQWSVAWRRVGRADLAHQSLESLLAWSVTDEGYVGERIHEETPWYYPWSPNASGSARLLKMLIDEGRTEWK